MAKLITVLTVLLLLTPLAAHAQASIPRTRVAFLGAESPSTNQHMLDAFRQGLREHGYLHGQNLTLETRCDGPRAEANAFRNSSASWSDYRPVSF